MRRQPYPFTITYQDIRTHRDLDLRKKLVPDARTVTSITLPCPAEAETRRMRYSRNCYAL